VASATRRTDTGKREMGYIPVSPSYRVLPGTRIRNCSRKCEVGVVDVMRMSVHPSTRTLQYCIVYPAVYSSRSTREGTDRLDQEHDLRCHEIGFNQVSASFGKPVGSGSRVRQRMLQPERARYDHCVAAVQLFWISSLAEGGVRAGANAAIMQLVSGRNVDMPPQSFQDPLCEAILVFSPSSC